MFAVLAVQRVVGEHVQREAAGQREHDPTGRIRADSFHIVRTGAKPVANSFVAAIRPSAPVPIVFRNGLGAGFVEAVAGRDDDAARTADAPGALDVQPVLANLQLLSLTRTKVARYRPFVSELED